MIDTICIMIMLALVLFALLGISDELIRIAKAVERLSKESNRYSYKELLKETNESAEMQELCEEGEEK